MLLLIITNSYEASTTAQNLAELQNIQIFKNIERKIPLKMAISMAECPPNLILCLIIFREWGNRSFFIDVWWAN